MSGVCLIHSASECDKHVLKIDIDNKTPKYFFMIVGFWAMVAFFLQPSHPSALQGNTPGLMPMIRAGFWWHYSATPESF